MTSRWLACAVIALACIAHAQTVQAGNGDELPVGNRAAMVGGAVSATVDDGSATYYNPAGLGAVERSSVDVSASAYALRFYSAPRFLSTPYGSRDATFSEFVAVPTQIAYVRLLGDDLALGLGYYVPRASDLLLRESLTTGAAMGDAAFAVDMRVTTTEYLVAAGIGTRAGERLRIGLAAFGSYEKTTESAVLVAQTRDRAMTPTQVFDLSVLSTSAIVGFELVLGAQLDVSDRLTLGAVARSPRLRAYRSGQSTLNYVQYAQGESGSTILSERDDSPEPAEAVRFVQLGRYGAGLAYRLEHATLSAEADIQPGYSEPRSDVERRFTWNARFGIAFQATDGLVVGTGLFSDRGAVEDDESLPSSRADFYGATLGLEINNRHALAENEPVDSLVLSAVFALRYAYGIGKTETLRLDPDAPTTAVEPVGSSVQVHELGLHVGSALYF